MTLNEILDEGSVKDILAQEKREFMNITNDIIDILKKMNDRQRDDFETKMLSFLQDRIDEPLMIAIDKLIGNMRGVGERDLDQLDTALDKGFTKYGTDQRTAMKAVVDYLTVVQCMIT